ncbi:glycosyl hydrolase [Paenibacillus xylanexedens]|uniref:glycosyl hydrolase n=1 Tax=Paenibacillus xylanexedens TaxID=528191 RepID=UPI001643A85C|nr:glycosyl hydrolase [Paenibacillus xylanexedens]
MWNGDAFENPEAQYRVHPFWFWNGDMEESQIKHQIAEMHKQGVGGFFICPRQGLQIPYLSEAWFDKVKVATQAADELGMQVWLYDEFPYPSGMAGGEVTLEFPEAKQRQLIHHHLNVQGDTLLDHELPWGRVLHAIAVPKDAQGKRSWHESINLRGFIGNVQTDQVYQETGLTSYNRKRFFTYHTAFRLLWKAPAGEWEVIVFQEEEIDDFKYYGNFVDPCHQEAMSRFIELTHDRYKSAFGERFESVIKGVFSDEIAPLGKIPWSPQLPRYFGERCGYSLIESLPALLYGDVPDFERIRYDYYQSLHLLLRTSYHKQVHDWCEQAGIQYAAEVPGVRMTTQLYSHMPGGDSAHEKIGRSLSWILERYGKRMRDNPKMVSSLARQLGRERNLIECFHSVGWSMTLQDAKWMIDRMAAMGTNFFNFHAFFYTIGGLAKHDAPPSQFLQNPYWEHFRELGDYTGRLGYLMSTGAADIRIAVLDPTTTLWSLMGNPLHGFEYSGEDETEKARLERLTNDWMRITTHLLQSRRDYDHLDPELLAEAQLVDGRIEIGTARYEVLILPPMLNLEAAAWKQVKHWVLQGGIVISVGLPPYIPIQQGSPAGDEAARFFGAGEHPEIQYWDNGQDEQDEGKSLWRRGEGKAYFLPTAGSDSINRAVLESMSLLLDEVLPEPVRWVMEKESSSLLMQTRQLSKGEYMVFLTNQEDQCLEGELKVTVDALWAVADRSPNRGLRVERLDLEQGQRCPLPIHHRADEGYISLQLAPYEAHAIRLTWDDEHGSAEEQFTENTEKKESALSVSTVVASIDEVHSITIPSEGPWRFETVQPNVLRMGHFHLTAKNYNGVIFENGHSEVKPFIDQAAECSVHSSLPLQFNQVFGTPKKPTIAYPLECHYATSFELRTALADCLLFMDRAAISGDWTLMINDHAIRPDAFKSAQITDFDNIGYDITPWLHSGLNELKVTVQITKDEDGIVDPLYLQGRFGVEFHHEGMASLVREPDTAVQIQPEPQALYPHFAGEMIYKRSLWLDQRSPDIPFFELEFSDWRVQDVTEVLVNGYSLGVRCWSPYRWRGQSSWLRAGDNEIEVRVTNTLVGLLEGTYFDSSSHQLREAGWRQADG